MKLASRAGGTAIHFVACNSHADVIDFVLSQGFDIESSDPNGLSPLHSAARVCNFEGCKLLLRRGAMVNKKCKNGISPLMYAILTRLKHIDHIQREKTVEVLLDFGENISDTCKSRSVLEIAEEHDARGGREKIR